MKIGSWKEYCTGQTRGIMWDKMYRIMKKTEKMEEPMLKNGDGHIPNPEESI